MIPAELYRLRDQHRQHTQRRSLAPRLPVRSVPPRSVRVVLGKARWSLWEAQRLAWHHQLRALATRDEWATSWR